MEETTEDHHHDYDDDDDGELLLTLHNKHSYLCVAVDAVHLFI